MFVQIFLHYYWYGKNTTKRFVGPFETQDSAESWAKNFQEVISRIPWDGGAEIVQSTDGQKIDFAPEKPPDEILKEVNEHINRLCSG